MNRAAIPAVGLAALAAVGVGLGLTVGGSSSGSAAVHTVTACATATVAGVTTPDTTVAGVTVAVNGSNVHVAPDQTIPGVAIPDAVQTNCTEVAYTIPTVTETVTGTSPPTTTVPPPGLASAHLWVDPAGASSCSRSTAAVDLVTAQAAGNVCDTPQHAADQSQPGDTILVSGGVYAAGFQLSGFNPASTVTFENVPGSFPAFAGNSSITNVSNVTLQGDAVGHGVGFSLGKTGVSNATNVAWSNVNLYCQNAAPWTALHSNLTNEDSCNDSITLGSGVNGFTWSGGDQSDWASCLTNCTHTGGGNNPNVDAIAPGAKNIEIDHVNTANYFSLDNNGSAGDHSEAWIFTGGMNVTFLDDRWTACEPPASTGYKLNNSCNTSYLFFGQSGSSNTSDGYTFTQDIMAPGTGRAGLTDGYNAPAGFQSTLSLLYDDIAGLGLCGASKSAACGPNPGNTFSGTNMLFVGNVAGQAVYGRCFPAGTYSRNIFYTVATANSGTCGPTDINGGTNVSETKFWVSPNAPDYDYTPTAFLYGAGENTYCPATDINGKPRPTTTPCDAGAVQH